MGYMICPVCKNEYTVIPVLFKPGAFRCTKCEWSGTNLPPWGKWFDDDYWNVCKDNLYAWLQKCCFLGNGIPIEHLKGTVAMRDGILLFKGIRPNSPIIVEYVLCHSKTPPSWLRHDSLNKSKSSQTYFHVWLANNNLDAVFVVDNPKTGLRLMEAWWQAEGRYPDVCWSSRCRPYKQHTNDRTFGNRKIICIGSDSLVHTMAHRSMYVSAYMNTPQGLLPEEFYLASRKLEDIANDPRNYNLTVKLPMAVSKQHSGSTRFLLAEADSINTREVRDLCRAKETNSRVSKAVQPDKTDG